MLPQVASEISIPVSLSYLSSMYRVLLLVAWDTAVHNLEMELDGGHCHGVFQDVEEF